MKQLTLDLRTPPSCPKHPLHSQPCVVCAHERAVARSVADRRALPKDGPDVGSDVPGGGAQ